MKQPTADLTARVTARMRSIGASLLGVPIAVVYALVTREIFRLDGDILLAMALGFLAVVPFVLGFLTVWLAAPPAAESRWFAIFMPWLSSVLTVVTFGVLRLEEVVCLVLGGPVFLLFSSVGGIGAREMRRRRLGDAGGRRGHTTAALLLLLPYVLTPLETALPVPVSQRTVANSVVIEAPPAVIWAHITAVGEIQPHEIGDSPFYWLGLPRPQRAMLPVAGPDGVRYGYFEGGLVFVEEILAWQPGEFLAFSIERDRQAPTAAPLQEIDGAYFQMLDGFYRLEPLADGRVRLHLTSRHQLRTNFNWYAGLWTDAVLWDLQQNILRIVQQRSEQSAKIP